MGSRHWDSFLQWVETPIFLYDLSHEVCSLIGLISHKVWRDCWSPSWPQTVSLCFSFTWAPKILFWVHQEWLQSPGGWAKGIRAQTYFPLVCWKRRKAHVRAHASWRSISVWHCRQHFVFYNYKTLYEDLGVVGRDRIYLRKEHLCQCTYYPKWEWHLARFCAGWWPEAEVGAGKAVRKCVEEQCDGHSSHIPLLKAAWLRV